VGLGAHFLFFAVKGEFQVDPILEEIRKIAADVAAELSVEFVHAEMVGSKRDSVVRVFIDKEAGVTLEDCSNFSGAIETVLDARDLIPGKYVLEISSPGIERELYSLADFVKFKGRPVKVKLDTEINGQRSFVGVISDVDGTSISFEDKAQGAITFDHSAVKKANLRIDLGQELKGRSAKELPKSSS